MRVLVIPDIHLKPYMFRAAAVMMRKGLVHRAVCLMDIADDWDQQFNTPLYEEAYDEAISFAKEFPETAWCWGNHDLSYIWHRLESGYSSFASYSVQKKILDLKEVLPEDNQPRFVHRMDNVLFSHGGVSDYFVREYVPEECYNDINRVVKEINKLGPAEMWNDASPIWLRPQGGGVKMYQEDKLLQVVGHTPVKAIGKSGNVISTDTFSTYRDGSPIGNQEFLFIDTITGSYVGVKTK